jgi:mRNA interferase MazF
VALVVVPGDYGKPRPAVVVQSDTMNEVHGSTIVCLFTTNEREVEGVRVPVEPGPTTGLTSRSFVMTDKIMAIRRDRVRAVVGRLDPRVLREVSRCLMTVLDLP